MEPKPLRILCFGDSLTEGYTHHGLSYAPYCTTMEQVLTAALPEKEWDISVDEQGVSGELVLHMGGRMSEICMFCPVLLSPLPSYLSSPTPYKVYEISLGGIETRFDLI